MPTQTAHSANLVPVVSGQATARAAGALPRHCSNGAPARDIDTVLFQGAVASMGTFRCPVDHPTFRDSGPIERCIVVFPRTSVWIRHEGSRPFVADPNVVTIYNRAQRYERAPLSPDGDRCDWFAVSDLTAREIAAAFDPRAADTERGPFQFEYTQSTPALYLRQRLIAEGAGAGVTDPLGTEEAIVGIVADVLAQAYQRELAASSHTARRPPARARRRETVEHAKAELIRTVTMNPSAVEIARTVGTSVFHLCRIFRAHTGRTMHEYRTELRVRLAVELLSDSATRASLSEVAHRLGFASHAHFVRICRRHLLATPGQVRSWLLSESGAS